MILLHIFAYSAFVAISLIFIHYKFENQNSICPEDMDSFYITLSSNMSTIHFGENTAASYQTKLAMDKIIYGDWEVGLSEISYSSTWLNIPNDVKINLIDSNGERWTNKKLPAGRYDSIEGLILEINTILKHYRLFKEIHKVPYLA